MKVTWSQRVAAIAVFERITDRIDSMVYQHHVLRDSEDPLYYTPEANRSAEDAEFNKRLARLRKARMNIIKWLPKRYLNEVARKFWI